MNINKHLIEGGKTLQEQETTLNFIEQVTFAQVVNYTKMPDVQGKPKANQAVAQDVPIGEQPTDLKLFMVTPQQTAVQILLAQVQQGMGIVFQQPVYVKNKEEIVLGFRKL